MATVFRGPLEVARREVAPVLQIGTVLVTGSLLLTVLAPGVTPTTLRQADRSIPLQVQHQPRVLNADTSRGMHKALLPELVLPRGKSVLQSAPTLQRMGADTSQDVPLAILSPPAAAQAPFVVNTWIAPQLKRNVLDDSTGFRSPVLDALPFHNLWLNTPELRRTLADTSQGTVSQVRVFSPLTADVQTYTLTGLDATLAWGHVQTADTQTYVLNGNDVNLAFGGVLTADAQTYALTGVTTGLVHGYPLTADVSSYALTGIDAALSTTGIAVSTPDVVVAGGKGRAKSPFRRVIVGNRAYLIKSDEDLQYLLNQVLAGDPPKKKSKVVQAPEEWEQKPIVPEIAAKVIEQTDNREVLAAIQKRLDDDDEADVEAILLLF